MSVNRTRQSAPFYKLSIGLEELLFKQLQNQHEAEPKHFDAIVIGSGYGGSIAAAELAASCDKNNKPLSVCVLERGNEYALGSFPSELAGLAGHTRINTPNSNKAIGNLDGLFDIRMGNEISAVLGNGLGGGSLINAGVMEIPKDEVFDHRWPKDLQQRTKLDPYYQEAKQLLGASQKNLGELIATDNNILKHAKGKPQKFQALESLAHSASFRPAAITVAMEDKLSCSNMQLKACNFCGDCATGCNHGAKESLDTNLLDLAQQRGATLVTGATVIKLEKTDDKRWRLHCEYTNKDLQARHGDTIYLSADKIIIAAGTYGSTEILLKSESENLVLSQQLGQRFSGNGDMIASAYGQDKPVNAIAKEEIHPEQREVGPTITGVIEAGTNAKGSPYVIQELAVPSPIRQLFEELTTTADLFTHLNTTDSDHHQPGPIENDICAVNPDAINRTSVLAVFGDDGSQGRLRLTGDDPNSGNGCISPSWPGLNQHSLFDQQIKCLNELSKNSSIKGKILPNPMWKFLPDDFDFLAESNLRGPLLTVHPLGGCPMGESAREGVVNQYGQVFVGKQDSQEVHPGLVVLDGAIIPTALSTNPALTIASVSLRAIRQLKQQWQLSDSAISPQLAVKPRAVFKDSLKSFPENAEKKYLERTQLKLIERLGGEVTIQQQPYYVDITASYSPSNIKQLSLGKENIIKLASQDKTNNHLRVFHLHDWKTINNGNTADTELEAELNHAALFKAPLTGQLTIFERETSTPLQRQWRGITAWLPNRGMRDAWQSSSQVCRNWLHHGIRPSGGNLKKRVKNAWALASRAGEVRTLRYQLKLGQTIKCETEFESIAQQLNQLDTLHGVKKLSYTRRANPWRQLMEMTLENFPSDHKQPIVKLDTRFLAKQGAPLFEISKQKDQPTALADSLSFMAYALRLLINNQLWSFRQPDPHSPEQPKRLPGKLKDLPDPQIIELLTGQSKDGEAVYVRLSRYRGTGLNNKLPVAMIHGYSANGTAFAHPAVDPNLASYFWHQGHDIWIIDLRTSSGMPSATQPWSFEDTALSDIPAAFAYIHRETGQKINVLAHCMGAAMFSMAILKSPDADDPYFKERTELPDWINCVSFSQVGPRVNFSPENIFRTYLFHYVRQYLPLDNYTFRPEGELGLFDMLLDRLLATLPYPEEEFDLENPPWKPWQRTSFVQTRHRMNALYGRDFSLKNVDRKVLNHIDDLVGPLSIDTIAQAIHFSRWHTITTKEGNNDYVSRQNFAKRWRFPTFSVHGEENGLSDVSTVNIMARALSDAGCHYESFVYPGYGHQDCLIGRDAVKVFDQISDFYQRFNDDNIKPKLASPAKIKATLTALNPWLGPHIGQWQDRKLAVNVGSSPGLTPPLLAVAVPVIKQDGKFVENTAVTRHFRGEQKSGPEGSGVLRDGVFPAMSREGIIKLQLPARLWQQDSHGVLLVLIHDDDPILNDPIFDRAKHSANHTINHIELSDLNTPAADPRDFNQGLDQELEQHFRLRAQDLSELIDQAITEHLLQAPEQLEEALIQYAPPSENETNPTQLCFAASSCQYPAGLLDIKPAFASYQRLANTLKDKHQKPDFLMLMGDQIYVDATAGLFDPIAQTDRFQKPYQQLYQNPYVAEVRRSLPTYTMLDDHEIINDWEPLSPNEGQVENEEHQGNKNQQTMEQGRDAFQQWQNLNPVSENTCKDQLWYQFEQQNIPFFVADSRTQRRHRDASSINTADMFGPDQLADLLGWLDSSQCSRGDTPKFIISPSMPFPRTHNTAQASNAAAALRSDGWDGFPFSFRKVLGHIADNNIENVVFLSGDAHLSLISTLMMESQGQQHQLLSIHSSGMYAPYPFANAVAEDFALNEDFSWSNGKHKVNCQINTQAEHIDTEQGFALIRVEKKQHWELIVEFNREHHSASHTFILGPKVK